MGGFVASRTLGLVFIIYRYLAGADAGIFIGDTEPFNEPQGSLRKR